MTTITKARKSLQSFGLNSKETRVIFALLQCGKAGLSQLSRETELPRTTLYPIIQKLIKEEFVVVVKINRHREYEVVDPQVFFENIETRFEDLRTSLPLLRELYLNQENLSRYQIEFHTTRAGLHRAMKMLFSLPAGERIYTIEGDLSVKAKLKHFRANTIMDWQKLFKEKRLVLESVVSEKSLEMLKHLGQSVVEAHAGRAAIAHIVDSRLLQFESDIWFFKNTVVILVPSRDVAVLINAPEIREMMSAFFSVLQSLGKKVDPNALLKAHN